MAPPPPAEVPPATVPAAPTRTSKEVSGVVLIVARVSPPWPPTELNPGRVSPPAAPLTLTSSSVIAGGTVKDWAAPE